MASLYGNCIGKSMDVCNLYKFRSLKGAGVDKEGKLHSHTICNPKIAIDNVFFFRPGSITFKWWTGMHQRSRCPLSPCWNAWWCR